MAGWSEQNLELGDVRLRVQRGGSGRPVLVLHHDTGSLDRLPFYDALADRFDVIVPLTGALNTKAAISDPASQGCGS